eukprot:g14032.t1
MKEISLYIICLLLISAVSGEEDLTCEAGYGASSGKIFTSGYASQCSGLSKITTIAECRLAAEYNSKNNIDENGGFGGRVSWSSYPVGCLNIGKKYWWNDNTKSTRKCSDRGKCICKPKTCIKCPRHTYSEGGTNPICEKCPPDTYTLLNSKQGSKSSCEATLECSAGEGMLPTDILTSGSGCSGVSKITTEAECKFAQEYNRKNNTDENVVYHGR